MRCIVFIIWLIFSGIVFVSCKKDSGNTHVEGYLVSALNNAPIPNGTIYLEKSNSGCWSCGNGSIMATYTTDASGHFSFDFIADADSKLSYAVYGASKYYQSNNGTSYGVLNLQKGHNNSGNVKLYPYGWIKFRVKNISPFDSNDDILINVNYSLPGFFQFIGVNVDTSVLEKNGIVCLPSCYDFVTYSVSKNGSTTSYTITVNTSPLDTITAAINY